MRRSASAAARASLTRLLADPPAAEVEELAGLLREACGALTPEGRPLYAGHADQPWPDEPVLQVWHGVTLLREHRGVYRVGHRAPSIEAAVPRGGLGLRRRRGAEREGGGAPVETPSRARRRGPR